MEMKVDVSLQTKQTISQVQMQSLNILAMSMTELQEYLQKEEIENPLVEYSVYEQERDVSVSYREYDRFYSGSSNQEHRETNLYEGEGSSPSIEDMIVSQLSWNGRDENEKRIVEFCIQSLDQSGYLTILPHEIASVLKVDECDVEQVLAELKELEPRGIFSADLEECLALQVQGMDQEELLLRIIREHLNDVAEGRISSISRALKLSSADVRKLLQVIKKLNPRPLNGYGEERTQYIFPDILFRYQDGQWTISLNDKWTGSFGINSFYLQMMETAQDAELKAYFEEKLRRAQFIMNAVEQRRNTLIKISEKILKHQEGYLLGRDVLRPMTLEMIAEECEIHKSTVSRAIRDKYLLAPVGCLLLRNLFTVGISAGSSDGEDVSRNTVKDRLKALVDGEDKKKPYSDEQLAKLLEREGMPISRRTVAKYRAELAIGGVFQRRE